MTKKIVLPVAAVAVALLAVGTFYDLRIDEALYSPTNLFGLVFAKLGMAPEVSLVTVAVGLLVGSLLRIGRCCRPVALAACVIVAIAGACWALPYTTESFIYFCKSIVVSAVVTSVFFLASVYAGWRLGEKHGEAVLIVALVGVLSIVGGRLIVNALKLYMGRRRFFTMTDPASQFTCWYIPQTRAANEHFRSFPSGHSFASMTALWVCLWPLFIDYCKEHLRQWIGGLAIAAFAFALLTMTSRLVLGKHFLSDVVVGASVYLCCFGLAWWVVSVSALRGALFASNGKGESA
jgi:membrane-associated phospholipid phosphatase